MVQTENKKTDAYALDKWLRKLGLWRGQTLRELDTKGKRRAALDTIDFSQPFTFTGSGHDPESGHLVVVTSVTSYDPESGVFEDEIIFWRHLDGDNTVEKEQQQNFVLSIRGVRNPEQSEDEVPEIIPDQIWANGKLVFNGPLSSHEEKKQDPYSPQQQRQITRLLEISKRVKQTLNLKKPVQDLGRVFSGGGISNNMFEEITGTTPVLRSLSSDGGWDPFESALNNFFRQAIQHEEGDLRFTLEPTGPLEPVDWLKALHGYVVNTLEPSRGMTEGRDDISTNLEDGMSWLADTIYEHDEGKNRHIFRLPLMPQDPPADMDAPEPFDVARLEYTQDDDGRFVLVDANFLEGDPQQVQTREDRENLIGLMQACNQDLSDGEYPDFYNHMAHTRLLDKVGELHTPPSLKEEGGEFLWIPMNGCSLEKKFDQSGDDIGGGNLFMSRGRKADGSWSEVGVLHGFPQSLGGADSDWELSNPDFLPYWEAIKKGGIFVGHDHFDHGSLEYYAKMLDKNGDGLLKGVPVICSASTAYIIKTRLKKLEVPKENWPKFVTYGNENPALDDPDLIKLKGKNSYAYRLTDEDGNTRAWLQICHGGSLHSAQTDSCILTGCYNDKVYHDSYYLDDDALGLKDHGWDFADLGQLALSELPDVSEENLRKAIRSDNELYISLEDSTGLTSGGYGPKPEDFKRTFRECMNILPQRHAVIAIPFSTNHLEYQSIREVWAEKETLRNSTAVGANSEIRDTCMNKNGVNPDIDLRTVDIPPEKLPQLAYDVALDAVKAYMDKRKDRAREAKRWASKGTTVRGLLAKDHDYQVFKYIYDEARKEIKRGNSKPLTLHKYFFNDNQNAFEEVAQILGLPSGSKPRKMPGVVPTALEEEKRKLHASLGSDEAAEADTTFWMIRSIANHGKVKFQGKCPINMYNMYLAIMAEQEKAARHGVRTSKRAKNFRGSPGKLGIISTGPTVTIQDHFASLSRYARGDSLFDYDEDVRPTGYKLGRHIPRVLFITQPPSMGEHAELAQEALIQQIVENRGDTIFCAFRNGFKIYNPKEHRTQYEQHFRKLGWNVEWDGTSNQLRVHDQPLHIHGHRFYGDMEDKQRDPRFHPKLVEFIHIPSWKAFQKGREIVQKAGRKTSIKKPDDHIARQYEEDPETGEPCMKITDYLTASIIRFRLRRKYGQQYGGYLDMLREILRRPHGNKRTDGLNVRTDHSDTPYFAGNVARRRSNLLPKPAFAEASARQNITGPAIADVQAAGGRPAGPPAGALLPSRRKALRRMAEQPKTPKEP